MRKEEVKFFLPDFRFDNLTDINADFFAGADLIIFDVDNTLVFSETAETKKEVVDWFGKINKKYRCICLSNSWAISERSKKISDLLGCKVFLSKYKKPFKKLFKEINEKYNLSGGKVFIVGDRIFTDILFGNLNKMTSVLVKPLSNKENIAVKVIRKLENLILFLANIKYN